MQHKELDRIRGGLVVSCQAAPGTPLEGPRHMAAMARAAVEGGAVGIRAEGIEDVRAIREALPRPLPLIGLWKVGREGVYITPTAEHALAVREAGADIVAVDATDRPRPDGGSFADTVRAVHQAGGLVMADVSTLEEGLRAAEDGADVVGTTLSGYTGGTAAPSGPDEPLVTGLAARLEIPLIAEGRIHTPAQARTMLERGAWSVVVGTAITAPTWITGTFAEAMEG
ncbi:N-acetylmannosamine-6-phosphate 2-epimerase [Streptomyces sp. ODS28]|uniref:N-acetylmannosamine-6-phosphate 2-epimerase n=1 Tax=Streptomyces sp. ODS28 TaxID=3136688 RepID=UPI0031E98A60